MQLFSRFLVCILTIAISSSCSSQVEKPFKTGAEATSLYLELLRDKQIGVIVNHTSLIEDTHLVDTLIALGVYVEKIFTPEHGFKGTADAGAAISDGFYSKDSIPVVSLYGDKRKPSQSDLSGIDLLLFDMQDVGVRTYTYIGTLHYIMEACAESGIPLVILDRPNPNGHYVDGPVLDMKYQSFVGMHPVPLVHGMTIGEFALMINGEGWLKDSVPCDLQVIPCQSYSHNMPYTLPVPPSPNLKDMRAVYLYPSLVLFEGTVISVGRGTSMPFTAYGHPDFSKREFSFTPVPTPGSSMNPKLKNRLCYGVNLNLVPIDSLRARSSLSLNYLFDAYHELNSGEEFFIPFFKNLAGTAELSRKVIRGVSEAEIRAEWQLGLDKYKKIRVKYLLYPE